MSPDSERYFTFLRGINVGGHRVKMDRLKALFEELELSAVETFIASGNVIFSAQARDSHALEREIEQHLERELGYVVATFIRSPSELRAIASVTPPTANEPAGPEPSLYVVFLPAPADVEMRRRFEALRSSMDDFSFAGREIYWHIDGKLTESPLFGSGLAKATGTVPTTTRNMTTVRRLVAKYGASR